MPVVGLFFNHEGAVLLTERYTRDAEGKLQYAEKVERGARQKPELLKKVMALLTDLLGTPVTARFSKWAGCSMCPCSPGYELVAKERTREVSQILWRAEKEKYQRYAFWAKAGKLEKARILGEDKTKAIADLLTAV